MSNKLCPVPQWGWILQKEGAKKNSTDCCGPESSACCIGKAGQNSKKDMALHTGGKMGYKTQGLNLQTIRTAKH